VLGEVLDLPEPVAIDADADFFALGGDSIASIRVVGRARAAGWAIAARDVFTRRTPAALAEVAEKTEKTETEKTETEAAPAETNSSTPLVILDDDELEDLDAEWSAR
jgi:aryl carrier-like protein